MNSSQATRRLIFRKAASLGTPREAWGGAPDRDDGIAPPNTPCLQAIAAGSRSRAGLRSRNHPAASPGFTLLELMVAIFIFAVIITTVFGSFRVVFSSTDSVSGDVALFETARTALQRMAVDLAAVQIIQRPRYRKPEFNQPADPYAIVGDTSEVGNQRFGRLRFASLAHLTTSRDARQGVARIVYYVQRKNEEELVLRRSDQLYPFPEFEENSQDPVLCASVKALTFSYLGAENDGSENWDSDAEENETATPRAVEVKLTVGSAQRSQTFTTRIALYAYRPAAP